MDSLQLEERLASIELRLSRIEGNHTLSSPPAGQPTGPWQQAIPPSSPQKTFSPAYNETKPGNWLGIISIICFVLAAGFIIKLSIESGWLTPARQIGLAVLLGLSLIGAGFMLMKSDRDYAALLPGAGIIVLYLTAFAAHRYYFLISFESALALSTLVSGMCIRLYVVIRHDAYAITAAVGAYIAPAILGLNTEAEFSLYYYLLCSLSFAAISVGVQSRLLTMISAYLAIFMTAFVGFDIDKDGLIAGVLASHFIIFSTGTYLYTTKNHMPLSENESRSFLPVLFVFYAMEYYFINRINPDAAPWISLGFAAMLIGFYLSARRFFPDGLGSQTLILAFATIVCFHSVYIELLPSNARPWLFVIIMLGAAFSPLQISAQKRRGVFFIPALAILAILVIEYLEMVFHLIDGDTLSWLVVSFAALTSLWTMLLTGNSAFAAKNTYGNILLGAAHILAILGLYRLTHDTGSLAVSASWLFYAVGVMVFAFARKDEAMAKSALLVLSFAAAKALLYDAASVPTIVRILCLLLTGVVLYGSGLLMRKIADWKKV